MFMNPTLSALQVSLADTAALYSKTHSFHWNVTGQRFQELHLFFETLYTTLWNEIDMIAEQIRVQGETAPVGYSDMISPANITEETTIPKADDMLRILTEDMQTLIQSLQSVADAADDTDNDTVEGFALTLKEGHEKTLWMMKSMV